MLNQMRRTANWHSLKKQENFWLLLPQNIDGLHQKAGSKNVFELHGTTLQNHCTSCGKFFTAEYIKDSADIARL